MHFKKRIVHTCNKFDPLFSYIALIPLMILFQKTNHAPEQCVCVDVYMVVVYPIIQLSSGKNHYQTLLPSMLTEIP